MKPFETAMGNAKQRMSCYKDRAQKNSGGEKRGEKLQAFKKAHMEKQRIFREEEKSNEFESLPMLMVHLQPLSLIIQRRAMMGGETTYWTADKMIEQVVTKAIPAHESKHPDKQAAFLFDHSTNHHAMPDDALIASRMNFKDGGKQPLLRQTRFTDKDGNMVVQNMQHSNGVQKGLVTVLTERGLWGKALQGAQHRVNAAPARQKKKKGAGRVLKECVDCGNGATKASDSVCCCAVGILASQPDFSVHVKSKLEEAVNEAGHLCIFLPKYHCELNFIEMVWGRAKQLQRNESLCTTVGQEANIRRWISSVTINEVRKYAARCRRFMRFYRLGCSVHLAVYATRKYRGHRMAPSDIKLAQIEQEYGEWKEKQLDRKK